MTISWWSKHTCSKSIIRLHKWIDTCTYDTCKWTLRAYLYPTAFFHIVVISDPKCCLEDVEILVVGTDFRITEQTQFVKLFVQTMAPGGESKWVSRDRQTAWGWVRFMSAYESTADEMVPQYERLRCILNSWVNWLWVHIPVSLPSKFGGKMELETFDGNRDCEQLKKLCSRWG